MTISFAEFKELPKKDADKNNLKPGKKYYIQGTRRKLDHLKEVYIGVYINQTHGFNNFRDVEFLVAPFGIGGKPSGFSAKSGHKFMEVIDFNPTELEFKNKTLTELHEFIHLKKAEPHNITPPISFMGEDYRKAKKRFHHNSTSKKTSSNRSSKSSSKKSSTNSKEGGRKISKTRRHLKNK
jgi:hypothetical protein